NRAAVGQGRVILYAASVSRLPPFGRTVDRILDINTFQFWDDPIAVLGSLNKILTPGGTITIAHQPRDPNAVRQLSVDAGEAIAASLTKSGFVDVRIQMKEMKPVPTVCVVARSPG